MCCNWLVGAWTSMPLPRSHAHVLADFPLHPSKTHQHLSWFESWCKHSPQDGPTLKGPNEPSHEMLTWSFGFPCEMQWWHCEGTVLGSRASLSECSSGKNSVGKLVWHQWAICCFAATLMWNNNMPTCENGDAGRSTHGFEERFQRSNWVWPLFSLHTRPTFSTCPWRSWTLKW